MRQVKANASERGLVMTTGELSLLRDACLVAASLPAASHSERLGLLNMEGQFKDALGHDESFVGELEGPYSGKH